MQIVLPNASLHQNNSAGSANNRHNASIVLEICKMKRESSAKRLLAELSLLAFFILNFEKSLIVQYLVALINMLFLRFLQP